MEEQEDSCLTVLEKNGLGPSAVILENYGIDSETDFLVRGGMVEGVGVWYLYEIALWLHAVNILRHTFRNH